MNYQNYEMDLETLRRYTERLLEEVGSHRPNTCVVSSLARTTAHLAEAMMANQTLNPATTGD